MKEADRYTKGFSCVVFMDHRNNLFTSSVLANKRVNKKLLIMALEVEEYGHRYRRVWIKGKENILGDAPSRNPKDREKGS